MQAQGGLPGMQSRTWIYPVILLTVLGSSQVVFGEIYKVVGPDGKITFSDKNPNPGASDSPKEGVAEQIEIKEGYSNKIAVTEIGATSYCGSIELPTRDVTSTDFYSRVVNNNRAWQSERKSVDHNVSRLAYTWRNHPEGTTGITVDNLKRLNELNCAVDWAQQQRTIAFSEKLSLQRKSEGLHAYLQEIYSSNRTKCGDEPIYTASDRQFDDRRAAWKKCIAENSSKMSELQADLKRNDALLLDIKRIEDMP